MRQVDSIEIYQRAEGITKEGKGVIHNLKEEAYS